MPLGFLIDRDPSFESSDRVPIFAQYALIEVSIL